MTITEDFSLVAQHVGGDTRHIGRGDHARIVRLAREVQADPGPDATAQRDATDFGWRLDRREFVGTPGQRFTIGQWSFLVTDHPTYGADDIASAFAR